MRKPTKRPCLRCHEEREIKARALCGACYAEHRDEYPLVIAGCATGAGHGQPNHEPTEEELDRMIREGLRKKNLPAWWDQETRRKDREEQARQERRQETS